jgi:hypothetical protein
VSKIGCSYVQLICNLCTELFKNSLCMGSLHCCDRGAGMDCRAKALLSHSACQGCWQAEWHKPHEVIMELSYEGT